LHSVACLLAMIGAFALVGLGTTGFGSSVRVWMVAAGAFLFFLAILMMTVMPLLLKMESALSRLLSEIRDLHEAISGQSPRLDAIVENTRISDAAKSLTHRDQEINALRAAIREEIRSERWEAALNLVDGIEQRFGYKQEADALREELDEARNVAIQSKLTEAIQLIETHFKAHEWDRAQGEIDRVLNALPDEAKVLSLVDQMGVLKEQHKQELHAAWEEAVRRNDVDRAIDVLRELDQYLTQAEAQALQSSARHVFKEKLLQLGVQFRFAVTEKRWQDALTSGLELVREFPNARMANEVREALDTLRERARQAGEADAEKTTSALP
jgi:tetratricopeptide (TPR) repeat protein